jgi:hypothetical protein
MRIYTIGQNEGSEMVGLSFLALCCFAFGYSIGRLGIYYGWWLWIVTQMANSLNEAAFYLYKG